MNTTQPPISPATSAGIPAVNVRIWATPAEGASRNLFAVETPNGCVLIDGPLRKSDGAAARRWLDGLGRPVLGVLLTHTHPDHYFGLAQMLGGRAVPVYATAAVDEGIRATVEPMRRTAAGFFGEGEIESDLLFPNVLVVPGRPAVIDGVPFVARDFGEAESAADAVWTTPALPGHVFSGDLVMPRVHLSLYQGQSARYIAVLEQLRRETDPAAIFFTGHGGLATVAAIAPQIAYLNAYREAVRALARGRDHLTDADRGKLVERMREVEPSPLLAFLIAGGGDPVARELAAEG